MSTSSRPTLILLLAVVIPLQAQPDLKFERLRTSGPIPSIRSLAPVSKTEISGFAMDPQLNRLHWIVGDSWFRLDLGTRIWSAHPIRNGFDLQIPRWGVVPGTMELRAWDLGVGRVVRIDSTGESTRIDQSFDQRTQYSHIRHIEEDGTIYAIGGVGLYHPKNYGVAFTEASAGWHRLSGDDQVTHDPFLSDGFSLKDPKKDKLILFSYIGEEAYPHQQGILSMSQSDGIIRVRHRDVPVVLAKQFPNGTWISQSSVRTGAHRIGFVQIPSTSPSPLASYLLAIDLDTYRILPIQALNENDEDPATRHMVLHYDETDSTLYSAQWTHITNDQLHFVTISRAKVDVGAIRTALKQGRAPVASNSSPPDPSPVWPWQAALGLSLIGLGWMWVKNRQSVLRGPGRGDIADIPRLRLDLDPVRIDGTDWSDLFGESFALEGQLLDLLARAALEGKPVVSSDTIDRVLIPNHPSLDYIRKTRNQTRKRLEESLQKLRQSANGEAYVLTDRDITDKRKTKLQLNIRLVEITPTG